MANKKISELTELTDIATNDYIPIVDTSAGETKKAQSQNILNQPTATATLNNVVSKNLFNKNSPQLASYYTTLLEIDTGVRAIQTDSNSARRGIIKLDDSFLGKTVTISATFTPSSTNNGRLALWFCSGTSTPVEEIGSLANSGSATITIPSSIPTGCNKIALFLYSNYSGTGVSGAYVDYTNLQIEEGSNQTSYTSYINLQKAMKEENHYSIAEQVIGQWIDGKPIYRKVIDFGALPNTSSTNYSITSLSIDNIIKLRGLAKKSNNDFSELPTSGIGADGKAIELYGFHNEVITVKTYNDRSGFNAYIILEYTKTTD